MLVKELRSKSTDELNKLVEDLRAELFMLRFKNSTGQLDQPHKISLVKKDIARVFTVIQTTKNTKNAPVKTEAKKVEPKTVNKTKETQKNKATSNSKPAAKKPESKEAK